MIGYLAYGSSALALTSILPMHAFIGNTDYEWYRFLESQGQLDEINFWKPSGNQAFRALSRGEPFFFKLKKEHNNAIVGFGLFLMYRRLTLLEAWNVFEAKNGATSLQEMWERVSQYTRHKKGQSAHRNHHIGCILLSTPVFFPEHLWIQGPRDWHPSIVSGKGYETTSGEGKRIWHACIERLELLSAPELSSLVQEPSGADRYGKEQSIKPRLGQGTFRYAVEEAYGKCAVTHEHSLPALEAAHIVSYAEGGSHDISNGLLLRADLHHLYDKGYVAVTPDYTVQVSERLRSDYNNGKTYYKLENSKTWLPDNPDHHPNPDHLAYHHENVFD